VLDNYNVNRVYFSGTNNPNANDRKDFEKEGHFDGPNSPNGYIINKNSNITVELGMTSEATIAHLDVDGDNPDANSLITKVSYRRYAFLMTGDIRDNTESELINSDLIPSVKADVLQAPHHGSAKSDEQVLHSAFLEDVKPRSVVISNSNLKASEFHPNCGVFDRISNLKDTSQPDVYWTAPHSDIEYYVMNGRGGSMELISPKEDSSNIQNTDPETLRDSELIQSCN